MPSKKIILTGGGSAGHVTPNLALLPALHDAGYQVEYIGSTAGIERELAEAAGLKYHAIKTGKLRRDKILSAGTLREILRAVGGISDAAKIIRLTKPDVIFSKGGFVGLPVAVAGKLCRMRVVLHESDMTSGLANRLSTSFASAICASFPETMKALPAKKAVFTGNPIRRELLSGNAKRGLSLCSFDGKKPVLLVTGGSLGSQVINDNLTNALPGLLKSFDIAHLCGRGKAPNTSHAPGYAVFEYLNDEIKDLFAAASIITSRAGSNAINEFLALRKPSLLIPLENRATRGDQILNAESFQKRGFSMVLREKDLNPDTLTNAVTTLYSQRDSYIQNMQKSPQSDAIAEIMKVIGDVKG